MTFRSPEFQVAFQKTLSYTLLYLVIPSYFTKGFRTHGAIFLKDFIFMVHTMLIIGLILAVANPNFVFLAGRYCSLLGNPNGIGIYGFLMVILVVCTQIKFPELFSRKELIWIYLIITVSVIMSGSRNAIMCIGIFLAFTKFYKVSYWYGFVTVIISIMLYQVVFANLPTILQMLGLAKALRADTLEDGSGRMVAWLFALKQLNTNLLLFIFGGGFSFDEYIFYLNRHALSALGHQGGVHNTYLAMWLNTGIIGLILWFAGFMRTIFKAVTISYSAFPIMYSVLFSAFFEAWLMGSLNPYHITFLLIFTLITTDKSEFTEIQPEAHSFKPGLLK
jgi:O-antigen ligase